MRSNLYGSFSYSTSTSAYSSFSDVFSSGTGYGNIEVGNKEDDESESSLEDNLSNLGGPKWQVYMEEANLINDDIERNKKVHEIAKEFEFQCKLYGGVIIAEKNLPNEEKSIKPLDIGGVAGGTKYICNGILFKFANDVLIEGGSFLYGGKTRNDEAAHKAAGHERKALGEIMRANIEGLDSAMMTIVDFLGNRLSAQAVVPIDGDNTLVYGSRDAGVTVKDGEEKQDLKAKLKELSEHLGLASHRVTERSTGVIKEICLPIDIEVHESYGKYYILDTARVFPPVFPQKDPREIFYRLFRREFLSTYGEKISSDAMSSFGVLDGNMHLDEVQKCTKLLLEEHIPKVVKELEKASSWKNLSQELQQFGVNMRYLGHVRECARKEELKRALLIEMCLRTTQKCLFKASRNGNTRSHLSIGAEVLTELREKPELLMKEVLSKYDGRGHLTQTDFPLTLKEWRKVYKELQGRAGVFVTLNEEEGGSVTLSDLRFEPRVKKLRSASVMEAEALRLEAKKYSKKMLKRKQLLAKAENILTRELTGDPSNDVLRLKLVQTMLQGVKERDVLRNVLDKTRTCSEKHYFNAKIQRRTCLDCVEELDVRGAVQSHFEAVESIEKVTDDWILYDAEKKGPEKRSKLSALLDSDVPSLIGCIRNMTDYEYALAVAPKAAEMLNANHQGCSLSALFWLCVEGGQTQACRTYLSKLEELNLSQLTYRAMDDETAQKMMDLIPEDNVVEHLIVRHACISDSTMKSLCERLTRLKRLTIHYCSLLTPACMPGSIERLEIIDCLSIDKLNISCESLSVADGYTFILNEDCLKGLKRLELEDCPAVKTDLNLPETLEVLRIHIQDTMTLPSNLKELYLTCEKELSLQFPETLCRIEIQSHMSDSMLQNIAKTCSNLQHLGISKSISVTDDGLRNALSSLSKMSSLDISDTFLSENSIHKKLNLAELNVLGCGMFCCSLEHVNPSELCSLKCEAMEETFVLGLTSKLTELHLQNCRSISDEAWSHLCKCSGNLTSLTLCNLGDLSSNRLAEIVSANGGVLRDLGLKQCPGVSGNVECCGEKLKNVCSFCLVGMLHFEDVQFLNLLLTHASKSLMSLKILNSCRLDMKLLAEKCPNLRIFEITEIDRGPVDETSVRKLGSLEEIRSHASVTLAKAFLSSMHFFGSLHVVSIFSAFVENLSAVGQCVTLTRIELNMEADLCGIEEKLPHLSSARLVVGNNAEQVKKRLSSMKAMRAVRLANLTGEPLECENLIRLPKSTLQNSTSDLFSDMGMLKKCIGAMKKEKGKYAFTTFFRDTFSMNLVLNLRKNGFSVICGTIDRKESKQNSDIYSDDALKVLGEEEGLYFVKLDRADTMSIRQDIFDIVEDSGIEMSVVVSPFEDTDTVKAVCLQNVPFERFTKPDTFLEFFDYVCACNANIAAAVSTLMKEGGKMIFHTNAFCSISEMSNGAKPEVRAAFVGQHAMIKCISHILSKVIVCGIAVGPFIPGLHYFDKILSQTVVADIIVDTGLKLESQHSGKVYRGTLEMVPP